MGGVSFPEDRGLTQKPVRLSATAVLALSLGCRADLLGSVGLRGKSECLP
jgi:hypothetical protein